jgi:hypothetical protein
MGPTDAHARLLGRSVRDCFDLGEPDLSDLSPELAEIVASGRACIAVTISGIAGHSGTESGRMVLGLRGSARKALLASRGSTCARRVPGRFPVASLSWPRTSASIRGSCFLPSSILRRTLSDLLIGHLPYAVLSTDTSPCLEQLGRYFIAVASQKPEDFEFSLVDLWMRHMADYVAFREGLLIAYRQEPAEWAEDVATHFDSVAAHAMSTAPVAPRDLPGEPLFSPLFE